MKEKTLSWNSRTKFETISQDDDFKAIVEFVNNRNPNEWIFGFYSYDNDETESFIKKLKKLILGGQKDKNFYWLDKKIIFSDKDAISNAEEVIKELEKSIKKYQSGILALFEPIDFDCMMPDVMEQKYRFHKKLVSLLSDSSLILFIFENINFDLEYIGKNSPLQKHVGNLFQIPGYRANELKILKPFRVELGQKIIDYCGGQSEIISKLENFWQNIRLENRLKESAANFIDLPIQTFLSEVVRNKLISLSRLLDKINENYQDQIEYNSENNTILIKNLNFIKNQYFKTGLFKCKTTRDLKDTQYVLIPKKEFEKPLQESEFIQNNGKIEPLPVQSETFSRDFARITAYFETKKPIFILGAGNSLKSGAPDRGTLFRAILTQIYPDEGEKFEGMSYKELKKNFQELINTAAQDDIRKRVIKLLGHSKPSIGHFHLTQLAKSKKTKVKAFITTNFDTLLEDSLMDYGIRSRDFIKLVSKKDITTYEWEWLNDFPEHLKIFKICGDMYYGSWLAVDDDDANIWIKKAVEAMAKVKDFNESHFFIILGHKFEETALSKIFDQKSHEKLIIVYANPSEKDCQEFEEDYKTYCKELKGISGYYGEFDNFMQELCRRLRERGLV